MGFPTRDEGASHTKQHGASEITREQRVEISRASYVATTSKRGEARQSQRLNQASAGRRHPTPDASDICTSAAPLCGNSSALCVCMSVCLGEGGKVLSFCVPLFHPSSSHKLSYFLYVFFLVL